MPTSNLCAELLKQYQCQTKSQLSSAGSKSAPANGSGAAGNQQQQTGEHASLDDEYLVAKKRRVVKFVRCWMLITREHFFQQQQIQQFLTVSRYTCLTLPRSRTLFGDLEWLRRPPTPL